MKVNQVIPLLRIFDEKKVLEFYCDWLGFVDYEGIREFRAELI